MLVDEGKINAVAKDILNLSRNALVVNLRFMDKAISMLTPIEIRNSGNVIVDGKSIGYDPLFILKSYKKEKTLPTRQYLHMIWHCVFQHFLLVHFY